MPKGVFERKKRANAFRIEGDVVFMELSCRDGTILVTRFSLRHLEAVLAYPCRWTSHYDPVMKGRYVSAHTPASRGGRVYLHRFVTAAPEGTHVDHDNHDMLDNRDDNLLVTTPSGNIVNRRGARRDSSSGLRGVYAYGRNGKWRAVFRGKHLGVYDDPAVAATVVARAIEEYRADILRCRVQRSGQHQADHSD